MTSKGLSGTIWRSLGAIFAGIVVAIVWTVGTDTILHAAGVFPAALGGAVGSGPLALATIYRTVYGVIGSYITARLAPYKPMAHVMVSGLMGLAANALGMIATWNKGPAYGPHWYPIALVVLALPTAWLGGWLWLAQHARSRDEQPMRSA
jgi:Na+/citrate or Na+/malate symporter